MFASSAWILVATSVLAADADTMDWNERILADKPVARWTFEPTGSESATAANDSDRPAGDLDTSAEGPRPPEFPRLPNDNHALRLRGKSALKVPDTGTGSPLDFTNGDSMTLEAWVQLDKIDGGQTVYVIGKGRTGNKGFASDNQNYGLRLVGTNGQAVPGFLFRDADNRPGEITDWHRWDATEGFTPDGEWHHVALTYEFGKPDSIRAYVDGASVAGKWSGYGGPTEEPPVVDDDELWIGSSMGLSAGASLVGAIDEVAIYRSVLSPEAIASRYERILPPSYQTPTELIVSDSVLIEVMTRIPEKKGWKFPIPEPMERFTQSTWALTELPRFYTPHGVQADRGNPLLVRMSGRRVVPSGPFRILVRARSAAILRINGEIVAELDYPTRTSDAHGALYELKSEVSPKIRPPQPGDHETVVSFEGDGQEHVISLDLILGGRERRPETGETCLAFETSPDQFQVLGTPSDLPLTDVDWEAWAEREAERLTWENQQRRRVASTAYDQFWERRHQEARKLLGLDDVPALSSSAIDGRLNTALESGGMKPLASIDDLAFLRRVSLDLVGTVPSPEQIAAFEQDPPESRRELAVDRLLADRGWADHWIGYWQDVLGENPNVVNPTLNNTGPFRFWIEESFLDNKPLDRFVSELILMEGSTHYGGPAGFELATQNDAPMAAKAHVLAQAFLGMEMTCARCHDAPFHDFSQQDLFSLAAMLKRDAESVPKTSTIPGDPEAQASLLVKVTLRPGVPVPPAWPFAELASQQLPESWFEKPGDTREQLATRVTSPFNTRFADVAVNRMWQRYFGRGLVEPIADWEHAKPSHPELLADLSRELVRSGYDLKHMARLMVLTDAYRRQVDPDGAAGPHAAVFAAAMPRRLSAEQLLDSLFVVSGKSFRTEDLNIDVDGLRSFKSSLNLGTPRRAWQLGALSNERDRPSLSLPGIQSLADVLETFGWRPNRPDPRSARPNETTVLQPAILANGAVARRTTQLSDDSRFTDLALEDVSLDQFVEQTYLAVLTRRPTDDEKSAAAGLLSAGFETRRRLDQPRQAVLRPRATGVSWTNHLQPEANDRKIAYAEAVERGDPATARLTPVWREAAEDLVWVLINSPEFVFVP
jgi:hypothetical protein